VPYSDTVTVAVAVFAYGTNVAVPGPEVKVQVPVPILANALNSKFRSHSLPPVPAFAAGNALTVFVMPVEVAVSIGIGDYYIYYLIIG